MSEPEYQPLPVMPAGICVSCGRAEPAPVPFVICSHCGHLVCRDCLVVSQLTLRPLCTEGWRCIISVREAKVLVCILKRVHFDDIRKLCHIKRIEVRSCIETLKSKGAVEERTFGNLRSIEITEEGRMLADTAVSAYSRVKEFERFLREVSRHAEG